MNDKEWISVDDRLPDIYENVWVYGEKGVTIGHFRRYGSSKDIYWSDDDDGYNLIRGVTFWIPIYKPEPPK